MAIFLILTLTGCLLREVVPRGIDYDSFQTLIRAEFFAHLVGHSRSDMIPNAIPTFRVGTMGGFTVLSSPPPEACQ